MGNMDKAKGKSFSMSPRWLSALSEKHLTDFRSDLTYLAKKFGLCEGGLVNKANLPGHLEIRLVADDAAVLDAAKTELTQSGILDHYMGTASSTAMKSQSSEVCKDP